MSSISQVHLCVLVFMVTDLQCMFMFFVHLFLPAITFFCDWCFHQIHAKMRQITLIHSHQLISGCLHIFVYYGFRVANIHFDDRNIHCTQKGNHMTNTCRGIITYGQYGWHGTASRPLPYQNGNEAENDYVPFLFYHG